MIVELADLIPSFPGDANRAHCFNHVLALVAKSAVRQFDVPKGLADAALDDAERELRELADGIDLEDAQTRGQWEGDGDDDDPDEDDNDDGWVDEVAHLAIADRKELEENIRPVRLVLVKVSHRLIKKHAMLAYLNVAVQDCIRNHQFNDTLAALVVSDPQQLGLYRTQDAARCYHTMELDV
jgi:hypothetical protein